VRASLVPPAPASSTLYRTTLLATSARIWRPPRVGCASIPPMSLPVVTEMVTRARIFFAPYVGDGGEKSTCYRLPQTQRRDNFLPSCWNLLKSGSVLIADNTGHSQHKPATSCRSSRARYGRSSCTSIPAETAAVQRGAADRRHVSAAARTFQLVCLRIVRTPFQRGLDLRGRCPSGLAQRTPTAMSWPRAAIDWTFVVYPRMYSPCNEWWANRVVRCTGPHSPISARSAPP
jgi:hypothetical protein